MRSKAYAFSSRLECFNWAQRPVKCLGRTENLAGRPGGLPGVEVGPAEMALLLHVTSDLASGFLAG